MPGPLPISEDLLELLRLLKSHNVKFVVVGAHALAFHGVSRFTEDFDFFVARDVENVNSIAAALDDFGFTRSMWSSDDLLNKDKAMIVLGRKPNRIDILNFIEGVPFEQAWENRVAGEISGEPTVFLSLGDYVATKKAVGRPKDISDLTLLAQNKIITEDFRVN